MDSATRTEVQNKDRALGTRQKKKVVRTQNQR